MFKIRQPSLYRDVGNKFIFKIKKIKNTQNMSKLTIIVDIYS